METQQILTQNLISYIKNISLHLENLFAPSQLDPKGIIIKTFKLISDFEKFTTQYNLKIINQIDTAKITVPLMFFRSIKDKTNDPQFMRFTHKEYELKFIFIRINLECHVHAEIVKNTSGIRKTCFAFQKLQNMFNYLIQKKLSDEKNPQKVSMQFFEENATSFLEQVYQIMNGEILCSRCRRSMVYQNELKIVLPPTIRMENYRLKNDLESEQNQTIKYIHQGCI